MPPIDPRPHGDGPGDRSGGDDPTARRRRGRGVVAATFLAGLAIVLAVLLLVPRCSQAVQDSGSPVDRPSAVEEPASTAGE
ncbi:hypothetical protein SAMN05660209_02915 [Geodermatophilus africanus]|uniref:Uncharacterized protein n=1 Tax=Geodermatophilus africanus TaxID=1137993 RepID=A0A1H3K1T4_9ACTN|nr:hypothetical protein [Geodermatophilus africanus]SDY46170.1 hypothetical protein SAMN05660209_02915 [Geodermatophilus africanus]